VTDREQVGLVMDKFRAERQRNGVWEYGEQSRQIEYKAQGHFEVVREGERGTSSTCPHCHQRHKPSGRVFRCPHCGWTGHRDLAGAGNQLGQSLLARESYTFIPALARALARTGDMSWLTLQMLGKILTGEASYRNLSGPVSIAQYAGESAQNGIAAFLWFLGIVSVSLGVLNLLPIPLLDGGHLMYYLIELVRGSPVPEAVQAIGQQIGLALLLGLMVLVFYNDLSRLMG